MKSKYLLNSLIGLTLLLVLFSFVFILHDAKVGITGFSISTQAEGECGNLICESGENSIECAIDCGSLLSESSFSHYLHFTQVKYTSDPSPAFPQGLVEFTLGLPNGDLEQYIYVNIESIYGHENITRQKVHSYSGSSVVRLTDAELDFLFNGREKITIDKIQKADIEKLHQELIIEYPEWYSYGTDLNYGVALDANGNAILDEQNKSTNDSSIEYYQQGKTIVTPTLYDMGYTANAKYPTRFHFNFNNPSVRKYLVRYTLKILSKCKNNSIYIDNVFMNPSLTKENGIYGGATLHYISSGDEAEQTTLYTNNYMSIIKEIKRRGGNTKIITNSIDDWNEWQLMFLDIITNENNLNVFDGLKSENNFIGYQKCNLSTKVEWYLSWVKKLKENNKKILFDVDGPCVAEKNTPFVYSTWLWLHLIADDNTYIYISNSTTTPMINYSVYYYPLGTPLEDPHKEGDTWYREYEKGAIIFNTSSKNNIKFIEKSPQAQVSCEQAGYECRASCFTNETQTSNNCTTGVCCSPQTTEQTCQQKGGIICATNRICNGAEVSASDTDDCCLGNCITETIIIQQDKTCNGLGGRVCEAGKYCNGTIFWAEDSSECCLGSCVEKSGNRNGTEEPKKNSWFYGFLGGIIIAIIGVVSYIIYEVNKEREWLE